MPVSLADEHEMRGEPVLPSKDTKRVDRAVGVLDAHGERPLDRRAEELELPCALHVRGLDVLRFLGMRLHGEERAAEAEVITRSILADVAAAARPHDPRREHASGRGKSRQVDPLGIADVDTACAY